MAFPFFSSRGLLGLNARNLLYIKPYNPRKAVAFADDKMKTKAFLAARGIPVAKMYARIESHEQLKSFDFSVLPDECVLKPNNGFGGEGIMILKGRKNGEFLEQGKRPVSEKQLREHVEDILDGRYSISGMPDTAFFEKILVADEGFAPFRPAGLPDIRIVVFNLVPVMAMLRVPTAQSRGKANVHLGGIGIGIDIATGKTTHAVQSGKVIRELPHGGSVAGIAIPHWEDILLISSRIQYITNIGYLAVDLTIDEEMGPALLEVNARAGLSVQIANLAPLRSRLERVGGVSVATPEKGVRLAQELFGKKALRDADGGDDDRPILGTLESISVSGAGTVMEVPVAIQPDKDRSVFRQDLADELLRGKLIEKEEGKENLYRIRFTLGGRKLQSVIRAGEVSHPDVRAIIGKRDLAGFLIDPAKGVTAPRTASKKADLRAIDKMLSQFEQEVLLLRALKPINLAEERARLEADIRYNPVFQYPALSEEAAAIRGRLQSLQTDDSPLGILLRKKGNEILARIDLLESRGNAQRFTRHSSMLFGLPQSDLLTAASSILKAQVACDLIPPPDELMTAEKAVPMFAEVLEKYGLHDWQVSVRRKLVADCTVGGRSVYLREGALFSRMHIDALIAHEIETHVLTAENGGHQPYELLRRGCAGYMDTQEGLAIFNQNRVLSPHHDKRYGPARSVLAVAYALDHSFAETRAYLEGELGYRPEKALSKAIDVKRGLTDTSEPGAFTKGLVYLRGLRAVEQFVTDGGNLADLYIGKVALEDMDLIKQIPDLRPAIILPSFLRTSEKKPSTKKKAK